MASKRVKRSAGKSRKLTAYNRFVQANYDKCGGDFKKIGQMWRKHKSKRH